MKKLIYIGVIAFLVLTACKDSEDLTGGGNITADNLIHVEGISTDGLVASAVVTRDPPAVDEENVQRTDAENISWLVGPLKAGLDITYGKASERANTSRVAILKLLTNNDGSIKYSDGNLAEYSFLYRNDTNGEPTEDPAIWYDNGSHFFEGLHIPERIEFRNESQGEGKPAQTIDDVYGENGSAANLTLDQHDDAPFVSAESDMGNYTLLSHYLGMPSNYTLNATVARIKLPFRHRLSRVLAYILIDPEMGDDVKIEGYSLTDGKDDATTSKIRFCNVNVLAGVKDSYNESTQHHTYTPQWREARKVIPHFVGERGSYDDSNNLSRDENFFAFYDTGKKDYVYPTDAQWTTLNGLTYDAETKLTSDGKYKKIVFGKVPVYDLIVRPTYTQQNKVMYDEEDFYNADGSINYTTRQNLYVLTNQIDFEITLSNGLQYEKRFVFDLDANYQTVVYLHISRERVDYNSSGSDLWVESIGYDEYYGVNNQNGNTLSYAGSGWQRAYTNRLTGDPTNFKVTDGHYYKQDSEDEYAQYVDDATWIEMFAQAYQGGAHHGDYFILANDITIPANALPDNFVFTGHLDGMDHTITLTGTSYDRVVTEAYDEYTTYDSYTGKKFIQDGSNYEEATGTYYQTVGENYSVIADLDAYTAPSAYTRESHPTVTYTIIDKNNCTINTTYYKLVGGDYEEISFEHNEDIQNFTGDIYQRTEGVSYTYNPVTFYKLVHHDAVMEHVDRGYLLSGLNGNYTTAQEGDITATWEANVHKEGSAWVPYKTATDGWRAEVINTNINGGTLFKDGATITGNVHNCWQGSTYNSGTHQWSGGTKVTDHTPSIPLY